MIKLRAITLNDSEKLFSYRENKALRDMFLGNIFPNTPELEKKWIENPVNLEFLLCTLEKFQIWVRSIYLQKPAKTGHYERYIHTIHARFPFVAFHPNELRNLERWISL